MNMTENQFDDFKIPEEKKQQIAEELIDEQLGDEANDDDIPDIHFDLSVTPSDPTLELLAMKLASNDLIVPFYQRKFVWKIEQASRLIESFLIGLPVPQVFFYVNDEGTLEIIDGQQRIMSIKYFFDGYFGDEDSQGRRKVFALKGLSDTNSYNGKTFKDLEKKDQRKLQNATLRAINIRQLAPSTSNDCVFHIFQRLNTGGTQLKPQEIRNAVYRGNIVKELQRLNENSSWLHILGFKSPHKNQRDIELILRLFGLYQDWQQYEKPMIGFLNKTMYSNRDFDSDKAKTFKEKFPKVCEAIYQNIEKPFRPKGVINTAMLDSVFTALLQMDVIDVDNLMENYNRLIKDDSFLANTIGPTADNLVLKNRIHLAIHYLTNGEK